MQFRLTQRHIVAFNFLLIAAIAYFAARSANEIIRQSLQGVPTLPAAVMNGGGSETHSRDYYDRIAKRDVFNLVPENTPAPVVASVDLHIKLLGTSLATRERPFAIIEDQNGDQALYTVGDEIPNAGKLLSVQKSRIIVLSGGQQVALDIPNESMPSGVQAVRSAPSATGVRKPLFQINPRFPLPTANLRKKSDDDSDTVPDVNVEEEGENHYGLKRDELRDALSHSAELFTQIHAIPNFQNGKGSGFTLQEIEPGSVFEDLGLEDGDQLTAIDGRQLENPAEAVGLLSTIQTRSSVDITVMRDGRPVQLHYDIR